MKDDQDPVRCPQSEMQPRRGGRSPVSGGRARLWRGRKPEWIALNVGVERRTAAGAVGAFHNLYIQLLNHINDKLR